ncbi:50S ribosomal protein L9 [Alphaproteobacteria bacterium]|nr:50S ribosomal protein L9 [Alphaproteobacteria bacterium]
MKIVLLEKIEKLGKMGDVVSVKGGFGRNYLLPQKKALRATQENIAYFEKQRSVLEEKSNDLQTKAEGISKKVAKVTLIIIRQASEGGNLYGSVSSRDISKYLNEESISISHTQVTIETPIKTVGVHEIKLTLHPEVTTFVKVSIAPSKEEAERFLKAPEEKSEEDSASNSEELKESAE